MDDQLPKRTDRDVAEVVPLARPVAQVRSPMLGPHPTEPRPVRPDTERLSVGLPTFRSMRRDVAFGMLGAFPVLLLLGWQAAIVAGIVVAVVREVDGRLQHASFSFGDGFLPYRAQDGWPRGVQEDDDVHWKWSATGMGLPAHFGRRAIG